MSEGRAQWAVRFKGLHKNLGKLTVGPIDLEIESGYVIAVVGPNGSGKSSLFRLMMNMMKPDAGDLRIWGEEYGNNEVELKRRIGKINLTSNRESVRNVSFASRASNKAVWG